MKSKQMFSRLIDGDFVLASASASRAKLLEDAGIDFCQYPVSIDERSIQAHGIEKNILPQNIAILLAEMKAAAAVERLVSKNLVPPAYVLGCDQILAYNNVIYNKPKTLEAAKTQLLALSGNTHQLFTAVVLFQHGKRIWHHLSVADMTMRPLDDEFINFYLNQLGETAFSSPASYQIESIGVQLFSQIEGCYYSILGIPLLEVIAILREHGLLSFAERSKFKSRCLS